ncbi:glycosyltransferase family 4 protein [Solirubrobacter soli]|uniref:glycosyltransferase family 4 protein n=1 Tax=Solirubrobacter soli TaxID=363832 RepID=UPI00040DE633|nr:glycosyltransferase family 4 protein [Solirubrobacter soli]
MRVHLVDPAAFTPPYDRALASALARAGAEVELITSRFDYGDVPAAAGVTVREHFYRHGIGPRRLSRLAQHVPDMLRYRRLANQADVVHFQWLSVQALDAHLLPDRPKVLTAHDVLPREPKPSQLAGQRRLYERMDAIVVHSEHGAGRLKDELGLDPAKVHVIPHGVLDNLADVEPRPLFAKTKPVVLFFGLIRPYKGLDVLLEAWRAARPDAELWVVGMPRMDASFIHGPGVRTALRFVSGAELAGAFEAADLVVLPYREIDQSGVLFTALAFGKPLLLSAVGGFPEIDGAELVPPGDAPALAAKLIELLDDPPKLARMADASRALAAGPYSWDGIARRTLELYSGVQT